MDLFERFTLKIHIGITRIYTSEETLINTQEDYLNIFDNPHPNYQKLYRFMPIGDKNIDSCNTVTQKMFPNIMRATNFHH